MNTLLKTLATGNTPTQITGASISFSSAVFFGIKNFSTSGYPTNNAGPIYIGRNSGEFPITISTGGYLNYNLTPPRQKENLNNFWIQGTASDALYVIYYP